MNKKHLRIVLAFLFGASIFGLSHSALAGFYIGAGQIQMDVDYEGALSLEPTVGTLRIGHTVIGGFSLEGRFGTGTSTETETIEGITGDFEVETMAGFYGVARGQITPRLALYGIAGATYARAEATYGTLKETGDAAGLSWGAGGEIAITPRIHAFIETMRHFDKDDYSSEGLTLGVLLRL
ncbi:outer membrane beta-barrel protein [Spiribacter sp. C176]|uniref:Outer membrane beta-barrel protein n=1 Tax=Spiribacter salilacus TaxID=2664894 RepID=A0A6N7QP50_9GAMM|nr:outer membrane beta-barrel protein [Spiribacter salilacus]MRH77149.1 outer membrane beta-barrel protein [Spiribacter salilacus]